VGGVGRWGGDLPKAALRERSICHAAGRKHLVEFRMREFRIFMQQVESISVGDLPSAALRERHNCRVRVLRFWRG